MVKLAALPDASFVLELPGRVDDTLAAVNPIVPVKFCDTSAPLTGSATISTNRHCPDSGAFCTSCRLGPLLMTPVVEFTEVALVSTSTVSPSGSISAPSIRTFGSELRCTPTFSSFSPPGTLNEYVLVCVGATARALPPVIVPLNVPLPPLVGMTGRSTTGTDECWPPEVATVTDSAVSPWVPLMLVRSCACPVWPGRRVSVDGLTEP